MAITKTAQESNTGAEQIGGRPKSVGFGGDLGLLGATRGSEYTNAISKVMSEMYAALPNAPKVNIFDRERMNNLAYSCIVVSTPNANNDICYHISLLEGTGGDPMTASSIVAEATRAMRDPNQSARIYTPDDAINSRLQTIVLGELVKTYGADSTFISTDGLVVHTSSLEINDLAMRVAAIAYNAVNTEAVLSSGEVADLNLVEAMGESGRSQFKLETSLYHTTATGLVGTANRQDFKVGLVEVDHTNSFELNAATERRLASVSGHIEAIREDIPVPVQPGMPPVTTTRLHPNLVLNSIDTVSPTQGFMFLGLAAGSVMSNPELWLQSLASIDAKSPNNPGGLNTITNIENAQGGVGAVLDFSSKSVTPDEHYAALKRMYSLSTVLSMDIESFGAQSYHTSLLAAAASPDSSKSRNDALTEIVETCYQMTNGNFPIDFNTNDIFATSGIVIPMGYWMDKSGERDIRDVDMAFVANQTSDVNLVNKWCMTALPRGITGLDPFLTKVEIIAQLIPDAVINGKAVRVTFTNRFIVQLTAAIEACGLSARYESSISVNEQYNTNQFSDYLATAGLSQATGFAHQYANAGNGLYTAYSNMGRRF